MSAALQSGASPTVPESGEQFASLWESVRRGVYQAPTTEERAPDPAVASGAAPGEQPQPAAHDGGAVTGSATEGGEAPTPVPAEGGEAGKSEEPDYRALYEGLSKELAEVKQKAEAAERAEARARELEERAKSSESRLSDIDKANREALEARIRAEPDPQKRALAQAAVALADEKRQVEAARQQTAEQQAALYREQLTILRSQVGHSLDQFAQQFPSQEGVHVSAEELKHFVDRPEIRQAVANIQNPNDIAPILQAVHLYAVERSEANLAANQKAAAQKQTYRTEETPAAQSGQTQTERLATMPDDGFASLWENVKRGKPVAL